VLGGESLRALVAVSEGVTRQFAFECPVDKRRFAHEVDQGSRNGGVRLESTPGSIDHAAASAARVGQARKVGPSGSKHRPHRSSAHLGAARFDGGIQNPRERGEGSSEQARAWFERTW